MKIVHRLLSQSLIPLVLDADGLRALNSWQAKKNQAPLIITPHEGEMARLMRTTPSKIRAGREAFAKRAALKFRCVCLLKGAGTLVTDGHVVWKNSTGNPAMASGGMGDVLTGIIAALGAPGDLSLLEAASLGAFVHGAAGDLAVKKFPERTLLASDLISFLPKVFKNIWRNI
jgi:NAD(P)H-hydrate epimerase